MNERVRAVLLSLLLACAACSSGPVDPEELMEADRDFARRVAEGGLAEWGESFADDAVLLPRDGPNVRGRAGIRDFMAAAFDTPGFRLSWVPEGAAIAESGDLGYTWGSFEQQLPGAGGALVTTRGKYVTIWRREADGTWKVTLDMGNTPSDAGQ